jgi:hypothetical protein
MQETILKKDKNLNIGLNTFNDNFLKYLFSIFARKSKS